MNDKEINELIQYYVEQTESGDTLDLTTIRLIAKDVERTVRHRCEDLAKKAFRDIGALCS